MSARLSYIPQLDGIRALAVGLVLLLHSGFPVFQAGWIGVPVFFTLSGFLITSILLDSKDSTGYFKGFYLRRALRIFPIYYLCLFAILAWGLMMHYPVSQFFYYAVYLQSFTISAQVTPFFCNTMFDHTWSLSVEELFYLAWPAVVYFISRKPLKVLSVLLCLLSLAYKLSLVAKGSEAQAFMSLPGSIDSLMIGVLLSLYRAGGRLQFKAAHKNAFLVLLILALVLLLLHYLPLSVDVSFFCRILLSFSISWLAFFAILYFSAPVQNSTVINRLFSNRWFLQMGKISYGLYLYHFPVYMLVASFFYHYGLSMQPLVLLVIKLLATFVVAIGSWHWIERPLLALKEKISRPNSAVVAVAEE